MDPALPIGLFDSGVGGLTVFKAIQELLPSENLVYLGDTARLPYGTKSRETISRYTLGAARKLEACRVKMVVIACNTATSAALPELSAELEPMPVLGVIGPGARAAAEATRNGCIGVIATEATIKGHAYQNAIGQILPEAKVIAKACTMLVPLAEEGWLEGDIAESIIKRYLAEIFIPAQKQPDTLLLGCTHFPLFQAALQKIAGPEVTIVDSARATARAVQHRLAELGLLNNKSGKQRPRFLTTDDTERFAVTGGRFLGRDLKASDIELVDL